MITRAPIIKGEGSEAECEEAGGSAKNGGSGSEGRRRRAEMSLDSLSSSVEREAA